MQSYYAAKCIMLWVMLCNCYIEPNSSVPWQHVGELRFPRWAKVLTLQSAGQTPVIVLSNSPLLWRDKNNLATKMNQGEHSVCQLLSVTFCLLLPAVAFKAPAEECWFSPCFPQIGCQSGCLCFTTLMASRCPVSRKCQDGGAGLTVDCLITRDCQFHIWWNLWFYYI